MEIQNTNKKQKNKNQNTGIRLLPLIGKNERQKLFFRNWRDYQVISLSGWAGTGKSFLAMGQSLLAVEKGDFENIIILRSAVSSRDIGFMPGNKKDKMGVYESPYISICSKLYGRADAYSILKQKNIIKFEGTSFLRGETLDNCIVILDESQNLSEQELTTVITRIGENCKLIIIGDAKQDDLTSERYKEQSGYTNILKTLKMMDEVYHINFEIEDIVRSGFVKNFIIAHYR